MLLCHGFTGSPASLGSWAADLEGAGLVASAPRLPGHGTTWQQMARSTWADWAARVDAELSALRAASGRPVVVGGLSMGGALALRLAADRPADVAGLVLVNPAVLLTDRRVALAPALAAADALARRASGGRTPRPPASVPGVGSDIAAPGVVEHAYDRVPVAALASLLAGLRALRADLPRVTAPLVLLRSRVDHVVPAASSELVLARVGSTDVRSELLARSLHVATLDHDAPRVSAATLELVARLPLEAAA